VSRAKIVAALEAAGCEYTIETYSRAPRGWATWAIVIDAPAGKWLISSGCGVDCSVLGYGRPDWRLALREVEEILAQGFIDADDDDDADDDESEAA
jgi:hypothetical protein